MQFLINGRRLTVIQPKDVDEVIDMYIDQGTICTPPSLLWEGCGQMCGKSEPSRPCLLCIGIDICAGPLAWQVTLLECCCLSSVQVGLTETHIGVVFGLQQLPLQRKYAVQLYVSLFITFCNKLKSSMGNCIWVAASFSSLLFLSIVVLARCIPWEGLPE